jgi:DNA-binding phage protein
MPEEMTTLRDVWEDRGMSPTRVAGRAGISTTTLYRMLHKEPNISKHSIRKVCEVLRISEEQYDQLQPER